MREVEEKADSPHTLDELADSRSVMGFEVVEYDDIAGDTAVNRWSHAPTRRTAARSQHRRRAEGRERDHFGGFPPPCGSGFDIGDLAIKP